MRFTDIRDIYICNIIERKENDDQENDSQDNIQYDGKYLGLFVRSLGGYKHILTGLQYYKSTSLRKDNHIIDSNSIELLIKKEKDICVDYVDMYQSCFVDNTFIVNLENKLNNKKNFFDEKQM